MNRLQFLALAGTLAFPLSAVRGDPDFRRVAWSSDGLWVQVDKEEIPILESPFSQFRPQAYRAFRLDEPLLDALLSEAPLRYTEAAQTEARVVTIPMPDGTYSRFRLTEAPLLSAELAAERPDIRNYSGQGIDDSTATISLGHDPSGFHAMILSNEGMVFVEPFQRHDTAHYMSYEKDNVTRLRQAFTCLAGGEHALNLSSLRSVPPSGAWLRTYRIIITATGDYTVWFADAGEAALRITNTLSEVRAFFERELSISFILVAFNIYTDPNSDPYDGTGIYDGLLDDHQNDLDSGYAPDLYDIAHILTWGPYSGIAEPRCVCGTHKGRGASSINNPADPDMFYAAELMAHEIGHQTGAHHSFNSIAGECQDNRDASTAYEPGSGSTIMSYAGLCAPETVSSRHDPYFHTISFDQIGGWRDTVIGLIDPRHPGGAVCGAWDPTGNHPPTIDPVPPHTIPQDTPFTLTATATDGDGDTLEYCWEQFDLGDSSPPPNTSNGPLFRSHMATTSSSRTFPPFDKIIANESDEWERLPTADRELNFRCTVRDNRSGGGGVNYTATTISVSGAPFRVNFPNGGEIVGSTCEVLWDVGGSDPVEQLNIRLSTDGTRAFTTLLANTANDGSQVVTLPATTTTQARIMIEAAGNIFFDVSDSDFTIEPVQEASLPNLVVPLYEPDVIDPNSQHSGCHKRSYGDTPPLPLGLHLFTDFDGDAGAILSYSNDSCNVRYDDELRIDFDAPYFRSDPNDPNTAYHPNPGKIYILAAAINAFCDMGSWSNRVFGNLELEFDDGTTADSSDIPELELTAGVLAGDDLVNWIFQSGTICYTSAPQSEYSKLYTHGNYGLVLVTIPIPVAYQDRQLEAITIRSDTWNTSHPPVQRGLKLMGITVREPQPYLEFKIQVDIDPIDHPSAEFSLYDDHGTLLESWAGVFAGQDVEQSGEQVLNNPRFEYWADLGPIPEGVYTVGEAGPTGSRPSVKWYPLTPNPGTWMWGRSGFFIHPGTVSHGCIVLDPSDYGGYADPAPAGSFRGDFEDTPGVRHALENGFMELRVVHDIPDPPYHNPPLAAAATTVGLASAASLLVTVEETGHACGHFSPTGEAVCNIDGAQYSGPDAEPQTVTMPNLVDLSEDYRIDLFPRYAGEYELGITYWPSFGSPTSCLDGGDATPGLVGRYAGGAGPDTCSLVEVAPGDFNEDGNVDLADYLEFQECVAGPGEVYFDGCADGDLNGDGNVDLQDFGLFSAHFSGW